MKAVIVGCGAMGGIHTDAYTRLQVRVEGVCDQDIGRAETLTQSMGCRAYGNLDDMLTQEEADMASICTPAFNHRDSILHLCQCGIPVFCEKPFVETIEEAKEVAAEVKASNIPFLLGFKMRYENVYALAHDIIQTGEIGALQYVFISHFQPLSQPAWYMDIGVATELLVHSMDITCWLFDETPQRIRMRSEYLTGKQGEDQSRIVMEFSNGGRRLLPEDICLFIRRYAGNMILCFSSSAKRAMWSASARGVLKCFLRSA